MKIYCSGIGGIGLSAYASLQQANGHTVLGSDGSDSALIQDLLSQGIDVSLIQDGSHVSHDIDLFVYSEAIPEDAPERVKAMSLGVPCHSYFHALGDLSKDHTVIAVCGTHGKSSTTAMTAVTLIEAGLDPTVVVGTKVAQLEGRNWRKGKSKLFVVEACEYRRSFHHLSPDIILVTNVDGDHFDAYKDLAEYHKAFSEFFQRLPENGTLIIHGSDPDVALLAAQTKREMIDADGFTLPELSIPGGHMRQNARLVLALAQKLGIDEAQALKSLKGFKGTWRRMELKGTGRHGGLVIDDYGHHPVEIRATLKGLREAYPGVRIVSVFQPHTHERTHTFYDDFLGSFADADEILVTDIYAARMKDGEKKADAKKLAEDLSRVSGKKATYTGSLDQTEEALLGVLQPSDVVVFLGAGDSTKLAGRWVA